MLIKEIIELPKGRRKIITDDGEVFCLYKGELSKLKLKAGDELRQEDYDHIMSEVLPKRAKLRGLNLLSKRPYTEYQLRQKYIDGFYPEPVIDQAIEYIKSLKCLDDYLYCLTYISYKSNSRSKKRIFNDLRLKGVNADTIERAYAEAVDNGDLTDESAVIERLMVKRHYDPETASFEDKQKIMAYLYNKGFNIDAIKRCI